MKPNPGFSTATIKINMHFMARLSQLFELNKKANQFCISGIQSKVIKNNSETSWAYVLRYTHFDASAAEIKSEFFLA